ncbi:uncharacterized protein [Lolium perenne]|uniref:uncharacterized protein n=1 Tax=Lolium perenne TaxID=4522 RepID=UPI0021EAC50D|nr:uncharacterized protein LOC127347830 [Lolium perenne]
MAPAAATIVYLGDDLLREVFLLLPTPADLLCAALACKPFLRAVRSAAFLRLFRRRHPFTCPPLLGCFLHRSMRERIRENQVPLLLPASPATAAVTRLVVEGSDFALSFLPTRCRPYADLWKVLDCRNGHLLLRNRVSGELAVADPLTRRCVSLPAPPAERPVGYGLVADDGDSSVFQAFCISQEGDDSSRLRALVLSSGDLRWADVAGIALAHQSDLADDARAMQANRSLYWGLKGWERMVELNTATMELSVLELPPFTQQFSFDVIEKHGEDGAARLYLLTMRGSCVEVWGGWEDGSSGGLTWTLVEKSVRFQRAMAAMIGSEHFYRQGLDVIGVVAGVLFLRNGDRLLSIDLETMKLSMVSHKDQCPLALIFPYTIVWPPSFLNPSEESA